MDIERFRKKLVGQLRSTVSDSVAENLANLLSDEGSFNWILPLQFI
jgi:hypothetical protein